MTEPLRARPEEENAEQGKSDVQNIPAETGFNQGIVVLDAYVDPSKPQFLGELTLPDLPSDALRSLAAGKRLIAWVRVEQNGSATVTAMEASWLPNFMHERVREQLERPHRWKPSMDDRGHPRASETVCIFKWRK